MTKKEMKKIREPIIIYSMNFVTFIINGIIPWAGLAWQVICFVLAGLCLLGIIAVVALRNVGAADAHEQNGVGG